MQLATVENELGKIRSGIYCPELSDIEDRLANISDNFFSIQRAITSPQDHLHEVLDIEVSEVDNDAISEILTQLGWEWFPRELNRVYSAHERVYRKADAKRQQILTNRIILLSFLAVLLSTTTSVFSFVGGSL